MNHPVAIEAAATGSAGFASPSHDAGNSWAIVALFIQMLGTMFS
jgi:hypothetical protein